MFSISTPDRYLNVPCVICGVIVFGVKLQIAVVHKKITIQIAHPQFFPQVSQISLLRHDYLMIQKCGGKTWSQNSGNGLNLTTSTAYMSDFETVQQVSLGLCQRTNTTKSPTSLPWSSWHPPTFLVKGAGTTVFGHRCSKLGWCLGRYLTWECEMVVVIARESAM